MKFWVSPIWGTIHAFLLRWVGRGTHSPNGGLSHHLGDGWQLCTCACALCSNQSEMSIESIGSCFLKLTLHATLKRAFNCSLVAVLMDPLSLSLCVTDDVIMLV